MAGSIKGIIVEIGGDTSKNKKALTSVNSKTSSLSKELRGVNSLLKLDPKNVELLEQKQTILNESIDATQDKLRQLQKIKEEVDNKMANGTKISEENYRNLQREIINTQNKLNGLTGELKQLDAQNSNWTKASKKVEEYGNKITRVSERVDEVGNKASVVSAGVAAGGAVLANSAMNLEDAVAKYISSTNTAQEDTEKYKQILEDINNKNYGEGYEDIAVSMSQVKMQLKDINDQDLQNITEKSMALRDLYGYDVSESVRAVKALMDNFNISADEAFNLIAEGKKQGLDFSNELLDNVNEYSVQFDKLGLSAQDMFNVFKVGADNGAFNLDKIGDAVKEFSIRAIDGSNTTIDGFQRIGLNADEMAQKFANGGEEAKQAFVEVVNRLGSMDDKVSQSIAGVDLFGTMWEDLGPTVVTSFNKMDNGISASSDSMQKSIDELYNTTKKKAEKELKRLQSLGADFGEEILPVLEDLIDMAEKFVDKLDGMSDAEKENIVRIGLLVAAAGPLAKIMGTTGKVIGGVTTNAKNLANIIKILTTTTSGFTGIIGALLTAYAAYDIANTTQIASMNGLKQEVENQKQSWIDLGNARQDMLNNSIPEIDMLQRLSDELKTITDENGKVKSGYETRAQVILNTLNEALGTEYTMNGNIINQYKELKDNVDKLIASKKAEAVLSAYQEEYATAIKEQSKATETLIGLKQQLADAADKMATGNTKEKIEAELLYDSISRKIGEQTELISSYGKTIQDYEALQKASVEGSADAVEKAVQDIGISYETAKKQTQTSVEEQINAQSEYVKLLQDSLKKAKDSNDTFQANILESQLETGRQQLNNLANSLSQQTEKVGELTPELTTAWQNLANSNRDAYSTALSKLSPDMQQTIIAATGVVKTNTPGFVEANKEMMQYAVNQFNKSPEARQKALDTIQGYINGLGDTEKRELLQAVGVEDVNLVIDELNRGDLSEESGKTILTGLWTGLQNNSLQKSILGVASGLANSITSSLSISIPTPTVAKGVAIPGHKTGLDYVPYDNYIARLHKGERVLTAKENKQLMSIQKLSKTGGFNLKGLANSITNKNNIYFNLQINPKSLTEADMKKCFDFMQKEAGKYY